MTHITSDEIEAMLIKLGPFEKGAHDGPNAGACIMEAVSFVAGEPWSDHPSCACPVISAFLRTWNDGLPDDERNALLRPLVPQLIGSRGDEKLEQCRAMMAADWLIRTHTPAWLRLAGLTTQAAALASLPEITDFLQCPALMPALRAARTDANAAWDAARDAAWDAARAAARDAARDAAWAAAGDAAGDAARDAARDAVGDAAGDAAWAAAGDAAWAAAGDAAWAAAGGAAGDAARDAARAALNETRLELQQSALHLVQRMIEAKTEPASDRGMRVSGGGSVA